MASKAKYQWLEFIDQSRIELGTAYWDMPRLSVDLF